MVTQGLAMNDFDLLFSLFSLLFGLAMAEILGDFGKVIDRRKRLKIGWLTPMLALLVLLDLASFWLSAFQDRTLLKANDVSVIGVMVFAGAYYLIATLVIPEDLDNRTELDGHYWENRRIVVGGIFVLNLANLVAALKTGLSTLEWGIVTAFYTNLAILFRAKSKRVNIIMLAVMISMYTVMPVALRYLL